MRMSQSSACLNPMMANTVIGYLNAWQSHWQIERWINSFRNQSSQSQFYQSSKSCSPFFEMQSKRIALYIWRETFYTKIFQRTTSLSRTQTKLIISQKYWSIWTLRKSLTVSAVTHNIKQTRWNSWLFRCFRMSITLIDMISNRFFMCWSGFVLDVNEIYVKIQKIGLKKADWKTDI